MYLRTLLDASSRYETSITGRSSHHQTSTLKVAPSFRHRSELFFGGTDFGGIGTLGSTEHFISFLESRLLASWQ